MPFAVRHDLGTELAQPENHPRNSLEGSTHSSLSVGMQGSCEERRFWARIAEAFQESF